MTDDDKPPVPWELGTHRCGASVFTGAGGQPRQCGGTVRWAGVVLAERVGHTVALWPAFACDGHREEIDAPRLLLDRDRARRAVWERAWMLGMQGLPRERPGPLATGAEARARHRRALALHQP